METIACVNCGSSRTQPIESVADFLLGNLSAEHQWVRCADCGLIYQNPRPDEKEILRYYPDEYDPYQTEFERLSWLQKLSIRYGMQVKLRQVMRFLKQGRLLDIGCSTGEFIAETNARVGWSAEGLEPSVYAAEIALSRGLKVTVGTLGDDTYPPACFDAVTMWDVLEHIHHPERLLPAVARILRPGGVLVMRFPNGGSLDRRIFGKYWIGYDAPRHLFVYDRKAIAELLGKAGFEVRDCHTMHGSYMSFILSLSFWLKGRGFRQERWMYAALKSLPIRLLMVLPAWLYSLAGAGSQLTVAALRKEIS